MDTGLILSIIPAIYVILVALLVYTHFLILYLDLLFFLHNIIIKVLAQMQVNVWLIATSVMLIIWIIVKFIQQNKNLNNFKDLKKYFCI